MNSQEHVIAVVEPLGGVDPSIEAASEVVGRGGRATVVLLLTKEVDENIRAFAAAEDLSFADAREIAIARMSDSYTQSLGAAATDTVTSEEATAAKAILDAARKTNASSVVVAQNVAERREWRREIRKSQVPILIAPLRAA